jgi:uncharacterized protein YdeI (YjbR/CyaY-like superfamily)
MHGILALPLRKSHRDAAGVSHGESHEITLELDTEKRTVDLPADVGMRLKTSKLLEVWDRLSYTHQREHVEAINGAKKPQTRVSRIEKLQAFLRAR